MWKNVRYEKHQTQQDRFENVHLHTSRIPKKQAVKRCVLNDNPAHDKISCLTVNCKLATDGVTNST